jgi:hypothetical protein
VIIYLFRDKKTGNFAITSDVTGRNLPSLTPSTAWNYVETIAKSPPPWEPADFQRLLDWLSADGFYLFEAGVKDPKKLAAGWVRPRSR